MPKTLYVPKECHGGGKVASLVSYNGKIVTPGLLQRHVIMLYHITLCHPGINRTEGNHWATPLVNKDEKSNNERCSNRPTMSKKQKTAKEIGITSTKRGRRHTMG